MLRNIALCSREGRFSVCMVSSKSLFPRCLFRGKGLGRVQRGEFQVLKAPFISRHSSVFPSWTSHILKTKDCKRKQKCLWLALKPMPVVLHLWWLRLEGCKLKASLGFIAGPFLPSKEVPSLLF